MLPAREMKTSRRADQKKRINRSLLRIEVFKPKKGLFFGKERVMKQAAELTTLCYIEQDQKYLMLHRVKKKNDLNKDKYIGIGGHFEGAESPDECLMREVTEETGLTLTSYKARGLVTFVYGDPDTPGKQIVEYMHLYTADGFTGELTECDEGELVWVEKQKVFDLPLWEGDKIFFRLLDERSDYFSLKLVYDAEGNLSKAVLDGKTKLL